MSKCYHSRPCIDAYTKETWLCKKCGKRVGYSIRTTVICKILLAVLGFLFPLFIFIVYEDAICDAIGLWPGKILGLIACIGVIYGLSFLLTRLAPVREIPVREMPEPVEEKAEPEEKDER